MKKRYSLPFIPTKSILFLDNSAFGLDDYQGLYQFPDRCNYPISYLKESASRLEILTRKLSNMDNWTTIWGVVQEFKKGNTFFYKKMKNSACNKKIKVIQRFLNQRRKTILLIDDEYRIADHCMPNEAFKQVREYEPPIENILREFEKEDKKQKTDVRLISTAIVYSQSNPACLFSQDKPMLKTFVRASKKFGAPENSFILSDKTREPIEVSKITFDETKNKFIYDTSYGKRRTI